LQRRGAGEPRSAAIPPIVHDVLRSSGEPLDGATIGFMTPRLGHDFSKVRVHTDGEAAESARAVGAAAYTVGSHVVFGRGQYEPLTSTGRHLIAHELAHVVQQGEGHHRAETMGNADHPSEREAELRADLVLNNKAAAKASAGLAVPMLQRSPDSSSSKSSGSSNSSDSSRSSGSEPSGSKSSSGSRSGVIPTPTKKEDGTCDCRLDICWRPIQGFWGIIGALGYKHGFLNVITSTCETHNLYVDPGQHPAGKESHSHAVDSTPGWDTSGEQCFTLNTPTNKIPCSSIDKLPAATAKYEALDVAYSPKSGPNSNSFLEWILRDSRIGISGLPSGLSAWDYYIKNPGMRSSPPRVTRAAAAAPTVPVLAPADAGAKP
jgi:hypothetical protein